MTNNALAAILRLTQDANKQVIDSHKAQQNALTKYGRILEKVCYCYRIEPYIIQTV
jgi:hypothetical protein